MLAEIENKKAWRQCKTSSRVRRDVIARYWDKKNILGPLLGEIERDDLIRFDCKDAHSKYSLEGRVVYVWGNRIEMREDMEHPDGIYILRNECIELIPYKVIDGYEFLTLKTPKIMGVERR